MDKAPRLFTNQRVKSLDAINGVHVLGCAKRYAAASLEKEFIIKLRVAYSKILGRTADLSPLDRSGNPVSITLVVGYIAFAHGEQKKGVIAP